MNPPLNSLEPDAKAQVKKPIRTKVILVCVSLFPLPLLISFSVLGDWISWSPDVFYYLRIARHFAETGGFPPDRLLAPPGYPIAIAPFVFFNETPWLALRIFCVLCWGAVGMLTYLIQRRELGEVGGAIVGLLVATHPANYRLATFPLSEMLFMVLLAGSLLLLQRWWRKLPTNGWEVFFGGFLSSAAFLTRSMGIVIVPVTLLALLNHSQIARRAALFAVALYFTGAILPYAAWEFRQRQYPAAKSYTDALFTPRAGEDPTKSGIELQLARFIKFGSMRLESLKEAVLPHALLWRAYKHPWSLPTDLLVGGFFVVVAFWRVILLRNPLDLFVVLSLLILAVWPYDEGVRFVTPLFPILLGYPIWVVLRLAAMREDRSKEPCSYLRGKSKLVFGVVVILLLAVQTAGLALEINKMPGQREKMQTRESAARKLARWLSSNVSQADKCVSITHPGDNAKEVIAAAFYLARRDTMALDFQEIAASKSLPTASILLVENSLTAEVRKRWHLSQPDLILGRFAIFRVRS